MNILIFSELNDASTNDVIEWLSLLEHNVFRINAEDIVSHIDIKIDNNKIRICLEVGGKEINLAQADRIWFRRGHLTLNHKMDFPKELDQITHQAISRHLFSEELVTLEKFIYTYLYDKPHIGNNNQTSDNKLIALKKAKDTGLSIPSSEINTRKDDLMNFFNQHQQDCISKGIQDVLSFGSKNIGYNYGTSKIEVADLEEMDDCFFPSLLQKNIAKKYELRIFYMRKKFYSMAIFSQNDEQTSIDFRNYNWEKPNRNVPFILPKEIEQKLELFCSPCN